jgi:hypothetical protein
MAESKRRHVANPIVQHGKVSESYAAIANDLVRDKNITAEAYRVLCLMLSHRDGYEESKQGVADRYGWNSAKTGKAFANLVEQHRLIIQRHTVNGNRAYEKYHVHRAGIEFTADQIAAFGETVVLEPQKRSGASPPVGDGGDLQEVSGHDLQEVITEGQVEDHLEHQREVGFTCLHCQESIDRLYNNVSACSRCYWNNSPYKKKKEAAAV